ISPHSSCYVGDPGVGRRRIVWPGRRVDCAEARSIMVRRRIVAIWCECARATNLIAGIALGLSVTAAQAEVMVVSSDIATLKPGMEMADTGGIDVPAGKIVRLMLPSGKTATLTGPTKVTVAELVRGEAPSPSVVQKVKDFLATGGVDQSRPGATRGSESLG